MKDRQYLSVNNTNRFISTIPRYSCAIYLVDQRVLTLFVTTLVYVERRKIDLHFVTRIPDANAMLIWLRSNAQLPEAVKINICG